MRLPQGAAQYGFGFWIAAQLLKAIDGIMAHTWSTLSASGKKPSLMQKIKMHMRKRGSFLL